MDVYDYYYYFLFPIFFTHIIKGANNSGANLYLRITVIYHFGIYFLN